MKKNPQNTKTTKKDTKKGTKKDIIVSHNNPYLQLQTWRQVPISKAGIEKLCEDIVRWATTDEDAFSIEDFLSQRGVTRSKYYKWKDKFEELNEVHGFVKMVLGVRREKGALKRVLDPMTVARSQAHYSDVWREMEEWRSGLRTKEAEAKKTGEIIVNMQQFPSSDLVPKKEDQHE